MRKQWAIIGGALILGASQVASPDQATAGPVEDAIASARNDVEEGRCEQAYRRLSLIEGLESRARLLSGQCNIRAGLYPEALIELDQARGDQALTPEQVGDLELYRGVALYHLERYAEASDALESANGLTREEAQLSLYRGLLALRDGDNDRAAPALESAARLSPQLTEPVASYYAGLAWQGVSERSKARDAFERVIALDPDGAWGMEARKLLETTELFPFYVRGSAGFEFDDNVLLRGDVTRTQNPNAGPGSIRLTNKGQGDARAVWEVESGVQLFSVGDVSGGVNASYAGNAHFQRSRLDTHYPTIGAYLANRFGSNTIGQARYRFGHAWVETDPYLRTHIGELSLAHTWDKAGTTVFLVDAMHNNLLFRPFEVQDNTGVVGPGTDCTPDAVLGCSPPGVNERRERKRDGFAVGGAVEHRILLPVPDAIDRILEQIELGGGYRFRYHNTRGDEWKHYSHLFSGGVNVELPLSFSVSTRLSYEFRDFMKPSTFPDAETPDREYTLSSSDRREHEVVVEAEIEKDLTDNLSVSTRYSYLTNDSNRDAYNYDRHIVGAYLNFRFD